MERAKKLRSWILKNYVSTVKKSNLMHYFWFGNFENKVNAIPHPILDSVKTVIISG
uniref:Uncharacterized protein n=1 Tax=Lepeophtheirus salmonis TaxID=72036 RepID=A0A0K2ULW8_LEPSM